MIPVYRSDSYVWSIETTVDNVITEGVTQLVTCREAIFAEGGGQPSDHGTLSYGGESRSVLELVKHKGDIRLRIEALHALAKGSRVRCDVDFARRYRIMRLHTCQHALAGLLRGMLRGYETRGMTIDEAAQTCSMRFLSAEAMAGDLGDELRHRLDSVIREGRSVRAEMLDSIAAAQALFGELFRSSDPSVSIRGRVRIIVIEGLDANACGGTHLKDLSEVEKIGEVTIQQLADASAYAPSDATSSAFELTFSLPP